jgi:hypothetical protein
MPQVAFELVVLVYQQLGSCSRCDLLVPRFLVILTY